MAVFFYMEHLDHPVVAASNEKQAAVRADAEVARMPACSGIAGLLDPAVRKCSEYRNSVIIKPV